MFDPDRLRVDTGETVEWVWDSSNHSVTPERKPGSADWRGTQATHEAGFTHRHTFEVEGTYEYVCVSHRSAGMRATLVVGEGSVEVDTHSSGTGTPTDGSTPTP